MIILPFNLSPYMKNYQLKAFELGIIEANEKSIRPWIYNKYINQLYMIKDGRFTYTNYDRWHAREGVTECQKLCVKSELLSLKCGLNIHQLIIDMLDTGHYVYGRYNEYYIPNKLAYQKQYYIHDFLLYGYDRDKQLFYSAGYLQDGKFQSYTILFNDFWSSLESVTSEKLNFHFIKYKNGIENSIDLRMICDDLFDYLHSINRRSIVNNDKVFGIECEWVLIYYFESLLKQDDVRSIDMRHVKLFVELKTLMSERIRYLEENDYLKSGTSQEYIQIKKVQDLIFLLSLKYNQTKDKRIITQIIKQQEIIIRHEHLVLTNVYHQLSSPKKLL